MAVQEDKREELTLLESMAKVLKDVATVQERTLDFLSRKFEAIELTLAEHTKRLASIDTSLSALVDHSQNLLVSSETQEVKISGVESSLELLRTDFGEFRGQLMQVFAGGRSRTR
jgi:hypothetical protein